MKFGLHVGARGVAATPDGLVAIARKVEALGFEHIGFSDHVVIAEQVDSWYPYTETGVWFAQDTGYCLEQLSMLSYAAGVTERLRLLTSVMVVPYRHPVLAAKMLATADVLSKGRVTVGVGSGWMAEEMALLGSPPYAERGRATDEFIAAFRALWTEPRPRFEGRFAAFDGLRFEPKPVQRPHPPLWVGGESAPARRRAGRLGDGWYPVGNNPRAPFDTPARYAGGVADVRAQAEAAGRDPDALATALVTLWYRMDEGSGAGGGAERRCFTGGAAAIVDDVGAYAERGLQHLVIGFESDDLDQSLDRIDAFAAGVMRHFA